MAIPPMMRMRNPRAAVMLLTSLDVLRIEMFKSGRRSVSPASPVLPEAIAAAVMFHVCWSVPEKYAGAQYTLALKTQACGTLSPC